MKYPKDLINEEKKENSEDKNEKEREEGKEKNEENEDKKRKIKEKSEDQILIPDKIIDILRDSVIRIEIQPSIFTGFFIKIYLKKKHYRFIFTCNHSISQNEIDSKKKIKIYSGKKYEELKKRNKIRYQSKIY